MADLRGGRARRAPRYGPKFSHFHVVFRKFWQNHRLAPPPWRIGASSYGKSWIHPCIEYNLGWHPNLWGLHPFKEVLDPSLVYWKEPPYNGLFVLYEVYCSELPGIGDLDGIPDLDTILDI